VSAEELGYSKMFDDFLAENTGKIVLIMAKRLIGEGRCFAVGRAWSDKALLAVDLERGGRNYLPRRDVIAWLAGTPEVLKTACDNLRDQGYEEITQSN